MGRGKKSVSADDVTKKLDEEIDEKDPQDDNKDDPTTSTYYVTILSMPDAVFEAGHAAFLLGNDTEGWYFYSKERKAALIAKGDYYETIEDFDNRYNTGKDDQYKYKQGYQIQIPTAELLAVQGFENLKAKASDLVDLTKNPYHLWYANCIDACSDILEYVGLDPGCMIPLTCPKHWFPNCRYQDIKANNKGEDISLPKGGKIVSTICTDGNSTNAGTDCEELRKVLDKHGFVGDELARYQEAILQICLALNDSQKAKEVGEKLNSFDKTTIKAFLEDVLKNDTSPQSLAKNLSSLTPQIIEAWEVLKDYPQRNDITHLRFFEHQLVATAFSNMKVEKPQLLVSHPNLTVGEVTALYFYTTENGAQINYYLRGLPTQFAQGIPPMTDEQFEAFKLLMDGAMGKLPHLSTPSVFLRMEKDLTQAKMNSYSVGNTIPYPNYVSLAKTAMSVYINFESNINPDKRAFKVVFKVTNNEAKIVNLEPFSSLEAEYEALVVRGKKFYITSVTYEKIPLPTVQDILNKSNELGNGLTMTDAEEILEELCRDWATNTNKTYAEQQPENPYAISEDEFEAEYNLPIAKQSEKFRKSLTILTIKVNITN